MVSRKQQLIQERADLTLEAQNACDAAAEAERGLTDAEVTRDDAIQVRLDAIKSEVTVLDRQEARRAEVAIVPSPSPDFPRPAPERAPEVSGGHQRSEDDPAHGFHTPAEYLRTVMAAGMPGADVDTRLLSLMVAAGSDEQSSASDPYGGFLVPVAFSPNVMEVTPEADFLAGRTMNVPMAGPHVRIPARVDEDHSTSVAGGLTVTRKAQTVAGSATRIEFRTVDLRAGSLFGFAYATEELMTDSAMTFVAIVSRSFGQAFADKMIDERINGLGQSQNEFIGVLNANALVTVAKEGSQAADTVVGANVVKMRSRCWGYDNSLWIANVDTYPQMASIHIAGTNGDVFLFHPGNGTDVPASLLGRPIIFTTYCETLGDKGDIILADWSQYLEGTLQGMNSAESIHVRFLEHERVFKFWTRNAGAPWWRVALTPKKGAATLSPFVTLAARA
jgi:HK97 family phage major capsid protein